MKYFILVVLFSVVSAVAVSEGDIAFVQYNSSGDKTFKFLCLEDIPGGSVIHFTDNGWKASGEFRDTEGILTWTAQAEGIAAGTIVALNSGMSNSSGLVSSTGRFNLSASGDQIIAYTGSINFITAINNEGSGWQDDATSSNTSALPTGLSSGTSIALNEADNAIYNGSVLSGDAATIREAINNPNNWITSNNSALNFDDQFTMGSLDVELVHFSVEQREHDFIFRWQIAPCSFAAGFNLYAANDPNERWHKINSQVINFVPNQQLYQFVQMTNATWFKLESISVDGSVEHFAPIQARTNHVGSRTPAAYILQPAYPNPFNPQTCIPIQLTETGKVSIEIYSVAGKRIKTVFAGDLSAGQHTFYWQADDESGAPQPSGVYLLKTTMGDHFDSQKLTLLR